MTALAHRARTDAQPSNGVQPTDDRPSNRRAADPRDPELRLACLLDPGTLVSLRPRDTSGAFAARGRIDGAKVIAYCTDATTMGGAMGSEGCRHIVEAIDTAIRERSPVIGLWHSGGARLAEGVEALDAVGQVFAAMVRASGRVPQISVVLGAAAGGAAYGPALTDVVTGSAREVELHAAVNDSFGFGGHNVALAFTSA